MPWKPGDKWRKGLFTTDALQECGEGPFEGWTEDDLWNGWAVPYFEEPVVRAIDAAERRNGLGYAEFHPVYKMLRYADRTSPFDAPGEIEYDVAPYAVGIMATGQGHVVWSVGARDWCWIEVERVQGEPSYAEVH